MTVKGIELYNQVEEALEGFKHEVTALKSFMVQVKTALAQSEDTLADLRRERESIAAIKAEAKTQLDDLVKQRDEQAIEIVQIRNFVQTELSAQGRELAALAEGIANVHRELAALFADEAKKTKKQYSSLIGMATDFRKELDLLQGEVALCQTREKALAKKIKGLAGVITALLASFILAGLLFLLT